jgi:hypothetical protein
LPLAGKLPLMRGLIFGCAMCLIAQSSFAQLVDSDVHYYTYAGLSHTLLILASADERNGKSFSFAQGKGDPRLTIYHRIHGELIWEGYFNESKTNLTSPAYPDRLNQQYGILAMARYRWPEHNAMNYYLDGGLGFSLLRHSSQDLPLANDFMIGGGVGMEFHTGEKSSILLGIRNLHTSNAGRKRPNFGENLVEYYIGYSWKR